MRRLWCLAFAACSPQGKVPARVTVTAPPATTPIETVAYGDCRIEGPGERIRDETKPVAAFELFEARHAAEVVLVIARPRHLAVAWSHLPVTTHDDGRARIEIGGQQHVRYAGYAGLHGRTFSIGRRFIAEPGHLWARAGAPVELVAYAHGVVTARVETPFVSPAILDVRGPCDAVFYTPTEPSVAPDKEIVSLAYATPRESSLALYAAPSGGPFVRLSLDTARGDGLDVVERHAGFTRVHAVWGDIEIDAWVVASRIDEGVGHGSGTGTGSGYSHDGRRMPPFTVERDTPLFVGRTPRALEGAVVERGATVYPMMSTETVVEGRAYVPFTFVDHAIEAAPDSSMWVAKDALSP